MLQSKLFTKTRKEAPSDEVSKNAQLLIKAGYVHKEMAGVYAYLPLGFKVLENIKRIIREEMDAIGGQELIMTNLQPKEPWLATKRWDDKVVDVWFKTKLKDDTEIGLAWSHEEAIMEMMQGYTQSYRDLPVSVYQFQTKLRNELRAKSGVMRGREFLMKDMYSLHASQEDMDAYYDQVIEAYKKIYERLGLGDSTFVTFAGGGAFTKFSHEFQTVCDAGEDTLYVNNDYSVAVNEEVLDDATKEIGVDKASLKAVKSAEVGNIFKFGTEKAEQMGISFKDDKGMMQPIYLASYGIGITRVMGVIVEKFADEGGIVWPEAVAPFKVHLIAIGKNENVWAQAGKLYTELQKQGVQVLYDDREGKGAGEKFADSDLIGIPYRIVVSEKTLEKDSVEVKERSKKDVELIKIKDVLKTFT